MGAGRKNSGFTMIEVLVAIVVLVLMVSMVYASFVSVTDTTMYARESADNLRFRQYIWRSFSENLAAVYSDAGCEQQLYQFLGEDEDGPLGPGDKLRFVTSLPMPGSTALPGLLKVVTYEVVEPGDGEGESYNALAIDEDGYSEREEMMLQITEAPLVREENDVELDEDTMEENQRIRQIPIATFDVLYYDPEEEDWVDDWDSLDIKRLPWAVHVKVNLARSEEELQAQYAQGVDPDEEPDLDMRFALPMGAGVVAPWRDLNHVSSETMQDADGDSIFNEN
jgi:prepilin-type N-terminal cleavage/methylation domain-containing protein